VCIVRGGILAAVGAILVAGARLVSAKRRKDD
jgi:hypothetical protein